VLVAAALLGGCAEPTVADACRNVCACLTSCGLGGVEQPEATCEADGIAAQRTAEAAGCTTEWNRYTACVYTASCKTLSQGCVAELEALDHCEGWP
jgi:hypothetical protein